MRLRRAVGRADLRVTGQIKPFLPVCQSRRKYPRADRLITL